MKRADMATGITVSQRGLEGHPGTVEECYFPLLGTLLPETMAGLQSAVDAGHHSQEDGTSQLSHHTEGITIIQFHAKDCKS